ncbi:MAG TPA: 4'-phosphopantetheinyl transferase superfamily protein [Gemmatimonadales bacterium]|nr:4'-phosphopantetheinyl transferase superfamily protein [Gemmatimonadales bacterium]
MEHHEVQSWCVPLDVPRETVACCYATLSADERARSGRLRFAADRRRFIVARGSLRQLLGRCLDTAPGGIRFAYNAFGKPALSPECGSRLTFNLSHSADLALIAIARDRDVGVDLECIRADFDYAEIARSCFSEEELDPQTFFRYWTRREAYVKARGEGLPDDPVEICGDWSFFTLQPAPGYVGTVVVAS